MLLDLSVSLSVSLCLSVSLGLSLSVSFSLSLCLSLSLFSPLCVYVCVCLGLSLSLSLCVYVCVCLGLSLSLCVCLCPFWHKTLALLFSLSPTMVLGNCCQFDIKNMTSAEFIKDKFFEACFLQSVGMFKAW